MTTLQRTTTNPKPIPKTLQQLEPSCKSIWLYIRQLGTVKVSQRMLSKNLGISLPTVGFSLTALREAGLIEGEFEPRKTPTFKAVIPKS